MRDSSLTVALRAQFSQLVQFFEAVESLLTDVMGPSVDRWVKTISAAEELGDKAPHVVGITVDKFTRDLIYRQVKTPLKVGDLCSLVERHL